MKVKIERKSGHLKRVFTPHSSSSSSSPGLFKKDKVKRLRLGERTMSSHEFKFPKKGFCDSIPLHPACVPRKLRSAISKRSCKSVSVPLLDSKRLKHSLNGVSSLRKYGSHNSRKLAVSLPISKEEEEVAETLFALAGMISDNGGESSEVKTPGVAMSYCSDPMPLSEDSVIQKEGQGTNDAVPAADDSKRGYPSWPKLSEHGKLNPDLEVAVPPVHPHKFPQSLRTCDKRQPTDSCWLRRVDDTNMEKVSFPLWQSQHFEDPEAVETVADHERGQDTPVERRNHCRAIGLNGLPIKSSNILFPSWVNATASSSRPGTRGDSGPAGKVSTSVNGMLKSRKRCITHAYISHLIQEMQPSQCSSIAPDKNDLSGIPTSSMFGCTTYKNICETSNRMLMKLGNCEDKDEGSKKQSFDFLSLSTGVALKANAGAKRLGDGSESNRYGLHLHSVSQSSASLPHSAPQNCFSSKAYQNQVAVASMAMPPQVQIPQYFANAFIPASAYMSHTGTTKQTHHRPPKSDHQQQCQQEMWTSQLAAQFRPGPLLSSHIANWQTQTQDPRISTQTIPPSQPSVGLIGSKYLHISQHQQQLIGRCPPLPRSSEFKEHRLFSS